MADDEFKLSETGKTVTPTFYILIIVSKILCDFVLLLFAVAVLPVYINF